MHDTGSDPHQGWLGLGKRLLSSPTSGLRDNRIHDVLETEILYSRNYQILEEATTCERTLPPFENSIVKKMIWLSLQMQMASQSYSLGTWLFRNMKHNCSH